MRAMWITFATNGGQITMECQVNNTRMVVNRCSGGQTKMHATRTQRVPWIEYRIESRLNAMSFLRIMALCLLSGSSASAADASFAAGSRRWWEHTQDCRHGQHPQHESAGYARLRTSTGARCAAMHVPGTTRESERVPAGWICKRPAAAVRTQKQQTQALRMAATRAPVFVCPFVAAPCT